MRPVTSRKLWLWPLVKTLANMAGLFVGPMVLQVLETYFQQKHPGKYEKPHPAESETQTNNSGHGTGD